MNGLKVSEEMVDLMDDWLVCNQCRDQAIKSVFKAKRAIYYGKQAVKAERKFWKLAGELYPVVTVRNHYYSFKSNALFVTDEPPSEDV